MKSRQKPIDLLDPDQVDSLVAVCSRTALSGVRDAALIYTLYGAALRVSEVLGLIPADVDLDRRQTRVRAGKGQRDRMVGLHPTAVTYLERWIARRSPMGLGRRTVLFCAITRGKEGRPLSRQAVDAMLKRRADRAGLGEMRVHAHALRHSMAVRMAQKRPVMEVQAQLGHSNLAVTTTYLAHLDASDLAAAMTGI